MRKVRLPEPAAALFARTRGILERWFPPIEGVAGWSLSGGTLLAGYWTPLRKSDDIDIKISPTIDGGRLSATLRSAQARQALEADLRQAGMQSAHPYGVQGTIYTFAKGRLELWEHSPAGGGEVTAQVEIAEEPTFAESAEQIRLGKLAGRLPREQQGKDLFDCAAALHRDQDALARAIAAHPNIKALEAGLTQAARDEKDMKAEASELVVAEDLRRIQASPVRMAILAIGNVAIREAEVVWTRAGAVARTVSRSHGVEASPSYESAKGALEWLDDRGIRTEGRMTRHRDPEGREKIVIETPGSGLSLEWNTQLTVDRSGGVSVSDMGVAYGQIGTTKTASAWLLERGIIEEEDIPEIEKNLEKERQKARALVREH